MLTIAIIHAIISLIRNFARLDIFSRTMYAIRLLTLLRREDSFILSLLSIRARRDSKLTCSNQCKSHWQTESMYVIFKSRMQKATAGGIKMVNVLLVCSIRWSKSILSASLLLTDVLFEGPAFPFSCTTMVRVKLHGVSPVARMI